MGEANRWCDNYIIPPKKNPFENPTKLTMQQLEISLTTLKEWIENKTPFTLIDIREEEERQASHMGGEWIPLSELSGRVDELPDSPIVFYCRSGARSLRATTYLRDALQRENIYSLAGGMIGAGL